MDKSINEIEEGCKVLIFELPEDHGWQHSQHVAALALTLLETMRVEGLSDNDNETLRAVCKLAAWIHDLNDKKMSGYVERWQKCLALLSSHPHMNAIKWIVEHVGVSREAGPNYANKRWDAQKWNDELETLGEVTYPLTPQRVLQIRHCVSCADMTSAVGSGGDIRAREFNERKLVEANGKCEIADLRKAVRDIHVRKHLRMLEWVHIDTQQVRDLFATGTAELVRSYNEWCLETGGTQEELIA